MPFQFSWNEEMAKCKIRSLKVFKMNIWSFYQNILQKMGMRNSSQTILPFLRLEKCQDKYYPGNLNFMSFCRRTLHVLMFSIPVLKSNLWSYWKWQTLEEKTTCHISWRQKIYLFSL